MNYSITVTIGMAIDMLFTAWLKQNSNLINLSTDELYELFALDVHQYLRDRGYE